MAGTIKLPMIGEVPKKGVLIGGAVGVAVLGILWWRKRSMPAAATVAPADATDAGFDDGSLDGDGIDAYGTSGGGAVTYADGSTGAVLPSPTDNAQWEAEVVQLLGGSFDPAALQIALGKYLTGATVVEGSQDDQIITAARGAALDPPTHSVTGYPPAVRYSTSTGQTTPPPATTPPATTGAVTAKPSGFVITKETSNSTTVAFHTVPNATYYQVYLGSIIVATGTHSPITITGLGVNTLHTFTMAGVSSSGQVGPRSGAFSGHTTK